MGILPHPAVVGHHLAPEIDEFGDAWIHAPHQSSPGLTATLRPGRVYQPRFSSPAASPRLVAACPPPKISELNAVSSRSPDTRTVKTDRASTAAQSGGTAGARRCRTLMK